MHHSKTCRALFLDRDGVINIDHGYVHTIDSFHFNDGIFDLVRTAISLDYKIIVVTNQAGIARGYYTESDLHRLHLWMRSCFASHNLIIDDIYYCPYHPTEAHGLYLRDSFDRKPNPGMILKAIGEHSIDPSRSILIGDSPTDVYAAQSAQVATSILLSNITLSECKPTYTIRSLRDAAAILQSLESN